MKMEKRMLYGVLLLVASVLLSASKAVYLASLLQGKNPVVLLLVTFSFTSLFFNAIEIRDLKGYRASIKGSFADIALLNVVTASSWISYFYAIKYLEPAIHAAVANSSGPVITIIVALGCRTGDKVSKAGVISAVGILGSVLILLAGTVSGRSAVGTIPVNSLVFGLGMAALCGVSIVCITFLSKRLAVAGWKASRIMAARFFGLLVIAYLLMPAGGLSQIATPQDAAAVIAITIFGVIIPIYCSQLGMERCRDAMTIAFVIALLPLCMFCVQLMDTRLHVSYFSLVGIIAALMFTGYGIAARFREIRCREESESVAGLCAK